MIKKILLLTSITSNILFAQFNYQISPITSTIKERMIKANSWRRTCPVHLVDLRYINVNHLDFNGKTVSGEIIVHKDIADEVVNIFAELYEINYPIKQMHLVADFKANDWQSIEADNTSAFNCRPVTGNKKKWSKHAYGKAIAINPIENPYVSRKGHISHKASWKYKKRRHRKNTYADRAVLLKHDKATKIFKKYGWTWGGDWRTVKDYQHFVKK
jgi:hypothetical protein